MKATDITEETRFVLVDINTKEDLSEPLPHAEAVALAADLNKDGRVCAVKAVS